jgi:hypothetical protein
LIEHQEPKAEGYTLTEEATKKIQKLTSLDVLPMEYERKNKPLSPKVDKGQFKKMRHI